MPAETWVVLHGHSLCESHPKDICLHVKLGSYVLCACVLSLVEAKGVSGAVPHNLKSLPLCLTGACALCRHTLCLGELTKGGRLQ